MCSAAASPCRIRAFEGLTSGAGSIGMLWDVRAVPPSCLAPCPAEFPSSCLSIKLLSRTSHSPDIFRAFLAFCWFPFFFAEPSLVWPRCVLAAVLGFSWKPHERGCLHPRAIACRAQISAQGWRQRDRCSSAARGARGAGGSPGAPWCCLLSSHRAAGEPGIAFCSIFHFYGC